MLRPMPEITREQENFRLESLDGNFKVVRRDPVEPVPVGTYVVKVFRVTGYDKDCDGSLMARLAAVDSYGQTTGWAPTNLSLYPNNTLVVNHPSELWPPVKEDI